CNGYTNAFHRGRESWLLWGLAWVMGAMIPVFVFVLFKAAGWLHKQANYPLSAAAAVFGAVLLFLSVADVQEALSLLTYTPHAGLSWAFACTVDCGVVTCELGAMGFLLAERQSVQAAT